jgi:hypothetical protein
VFLLFQSRTRGSRTHNYKELFTKRQGTWNAPTVCQADVGKPVDVRSVAGQRGRNDDLSGGRSEPVPSRWQRRECTVAPGGVEQSGLRSVWVPLASRCGGVFVDMRPTDFACYALLHQWCECTTGQWTTARREQQPMWIVEM